MLFRNQPLKTSTNSVILNNKSTMSSTITFDVGYIHSFRHKMNRGLPVNVMRTLNMKTKIRTTLNNQELELMSKKLDNFNPEELQKKINSLLNKLAKTNLEGIFQKVNEILKNRKVLIEFTIKKLMMYAIQMPTLMDTYALFYQKLYSDKTEEIFQSTFQELMNVLNGKVDSSKISSTENYDKFINYLQDKGKYTGLHLFLNSLVDLKIVKEQQMKDQIKTLEEIILVSTPEQNEKYAECYCKLLKKINKKKYINLRKITQIKKAKVLSMRMRFGLLDLEDLHKKL